MVWEARTPLTGDCIKQRLSSRPDIKQQLTAHSSDPGANSPTTKHVNTRFGFDANTWPLDPKSQQLYFNFTLRSALVEGTPLLHVSWTNESYAGGLGDVLFCLFITVFVRRPFSMSLTSNHADASQGFAARAIFC